MFEMVLIESQNEISRDKWKKIEWRASETNEMYGIKINDPISIEHILCIKMYCDISVLCSTFRESYRKTGNDDNNTKIKQQHNNNFYWMGRFIYCAIQFFGEKAIKPTSCINNNNNNFYHGLHEQFLFNQFSAVFEAPTSTTREFKIAYNNFASDGIVLQLAPKYKNEMNFSKCLDVSKISIHNEQERLVKLYYK